MPETTLYMVYYAEYDDWSGGDVLRGPVGIDLSALAKVFFPVWDHGEQALMEKCNERINKGDSAGWDRTIDESIAISTWREEQGWDGHSFVQAFTAWLVQQHGFDTVPVYWFNTAHIEKPEHLPTATSA